MLRIALGSEHAKELLTPDEFKRYKSANDNTFDFLKKEDWFTTDFARRVLKEIDRVEMEGPFSVKSLELDEHYNVNDLSGGAHTLFLMNCYRNFIYLAQMGENCIDFLEEIAADYEREGKDLTIVSNWLMDFNFKHIDKVYFINWNKTCYNQDQIDDDIFPLWYRQERDGLDKDEDEYDEETERLIDEHLKPLMNAIAKREQEESREKSDKF